MKWLRLPTGAHKLAWAGLFGAAGLGYLFWDPYRDGAPWLDWFWAAVTCAVFLALVTLVMQRLCAAMIVVAVAYTAYRPAGMALFVLVAGFAPLAVGGGVRRSAVAVGGIVLLSLAEWHLLRPPGPMPYIIALESFLVGAAITFVRERQRAVDLILQTAERERIARDMHDILGHALSVIALKAELAGRLLERDAERAKGELADVERLSRNALFEMREAIAVIAAAGNQRSATRAGAPLPSERGAGRRCAPFRGQR